MLNSVSLMGRLCADPVLNTTSDGTKVTTFTIAVDRNFVNKDKKRDADFIEVTAWRKTAEFVCDNFKKGSAIAIHGSLRSHNYEDTAGNKRKAIEVFADDVSFCERKTKE